MSAGHGHPDAHGNKGIALLISILALVLAFSETLGKAAQTSALSSNIEASNLWAFYQAKTIRQTSLRATADAIDTIATSAAARDKSAEMRKTAERYQSEPETGEGRKELAERAKKAETARDRALAAYHQYELASAALQIAIVLASASIITGIALLTWIAGGLGVVGAVLSAGGLLAPTALHLF
jgi:hypothetical protein